MADVLGPPHVYGASIMSNDKQLRSEALQGQMLTFYYRNGSEHRGNIVQDTR